MNSKTKCRRKTPHVWWVRVARTKPKIYKSRGHGGPSRRDLVDPRSDQGKPYNGADEGPSPKRAARVGSYPANSWGMHDLHGNVFEWCRDWYHAKLPGGNDPDLYLLKGSKNRDGTYSRVRRGGAWTDDGWTCRSACRIRFEAERRSDHIGFRIVAVRSVR